MVRSRSGERLATSSTAEASKSSMDLRFCQAYFWHQFMSCRSKYSVVSKVRTLPYSQKGRAHSRLVFIIVVWCIAASRYVYQIMAATQQHVLSISQSTSGALLVSHYCSRFRITTSIRAAPRGCGRTFMSPRS